MNLRDYFHVLNPSQRQRPSVALFFKSDPSLQCAWVNRSSHPMHLETILEWALKEGYLKLAVWGGDGTLSRALQFLYETNSLNKVTIALFPAGTCNDFFRKVYGEPTLKVKDWTITERFMDLGLLQCGNAHRVFINNSGFGRTQIALGRKRSNPIKDIISFTPKNIRVEWQERGRWVEERKRFILGMVCNAPYFSGGLHFNSQCDPADGLLNGFFEAEQSKAAMIIKFIKGRWGRPLAGSNTFFVKSSDLRVTSDELLYPQVDGEPANISGVTSLSYSLLPRAVRFVVWGSKNRIQGK